MRQGFLKIAFFAILFLCLAVFAVLLHLSVFPFLIFCFSVGFFLLCRENEFLGLLAVVFLLPFFLVFPDIVGKNFFGFQDFLVLVLAIEFFSSRFLAKEIAIEKTGLFTVFCVFFLAYLASSAIVLSAAVYSGGFTGISAPVAVSKVLPRLFAVGEWLVFFFACFSIIKSREQLEKALSVMLVVFFLASAFAVLQYNFNVLGTEKADFSGISVGSVLGISSLHAQRVLSFLGGQNTLGFYCLLMLPLAFAFFLLKKGAKKIFFLLAFVAGFFALYYSGSRGAFSGFILQAVLIVGFVASDFFSLPKKRLVKAISFSMVLLLVFLVFFFAFQDKLSFLGRSIDFENEWSSRIRVSAIWPFAITLALQNPVFGIGPGLYSSFFAKARNSIDLTSVTPWFVASHSHNLFLEIALDAGLLGLAFFAIILVKLFLELSKKSFAGEKQKSVIAVFLIISFIGFFAASLFDYSFAVQGIALLFWCLVAISFRL